MSLSVLSSNRSGIVCCLVFMGRVLVEVKTAQIGAYQCLEKSGGKNKV